MEQMYKYICDKNKLYNKNVVRNKCTAAIVHNSYDVVAKNVRQNLMSFIIIIELIVLKLRSPKDRPISV